MTPRPDQEIASEIAICLRHKFLNSVHGVAVGQPVGDSSREMNETVAEKNGRAYGDPRSVTTMIGPAGNAWPIERHAVAEPHETV
jgi:hypothetical protein